MSAENGKVAVQAFVDAFNRVDVPAIASALNFPHIRLNQGKLNIFETREDFIARTANLKASLATEGWHHTTLESVDVIHAAPEKVHMTIEFTRCRADDSVYTRFQTLWIATLQDGLGDCVPVELFGGVGLSLVV